jgi:intracellular multiplication protein IcmG
MMAEHDQNNDDYKFEEYDSLGNEFSEPKEETTPAATSRLPDASPTDVRRNALIVLGLVIFGYLLYKIIGNLFFTKVEPVKPSIPPVTQVAPQPQPIQQPVVPVIQPQPDNTAAFNDIKQKVAAIEVSQQSTKTDLSNVSGQVSSMSATINTLNSQIDKLNQTIADLSNQVSKQSMEINELIAKKKPKPVKRVFKASAPINRYHIQAIIPGRAWLIATNGSTLTVREGSTIAGYGVVKLIDAIQGRVLTSSGRVIKFSQTDS